jgi:hypothetical protein
MALPRLPVTIDIPASQCLKNVESAQPDQSLRRFDDPGKQ